MNLLKTLAMTAVLASSSILQAQQADTTEPAPATSRAMQLSFITPFGTNGLQSWECTNNFSINILAGYAGGVKGAEFSGLTSVIRWNMHGAQFAGLGNIVLGETGGTQFSGLFNVGLNQLKGWQFSGFGNVVTGKSTGLQVAGFGNYARGGKVTQISGFANVVPDSNTGAQIAGFGNVAVHSGKGVQLAGAVNIHTGSLTGAQISGLFNWARRLEGVQIAPFNYVDSLERGVPIGVFSIVRNGYRTVEFTATETLFGVVSFKTGVRSFYNIISTGIAYRGDRVIWGWGYGIGGLISLAPAWDLSIEGLCYQINEGEWFTNRLNLLNKLQALASWKLSPAVTLVGGVSWNVTVSDITDEYGDPVTPHIAPWSVYNETSGRISLTMYPGITAGIRL